VYDKLHETEPEFDAADWTPKWDELRIELWTTEEAAETLLAQLDAALARANARCAELVADAERRRAEQAERGDDERDEAARLQQKLDAL
jgi:hypothetical protein